MIIQSNIESVIIQIVAMEYGLGENNVTMVYILHNKGNSYSRDGCTNCKFDSGYYCSSIIL